MILDFTFVWSQRLFQTLFWIFYSLSVAWKRLKRVRLMLLGYTLVWNLRWLQRQSTVFGQSCGDVDVDKE